MPSAEPGPRPGAPSGGRICPVVFTASVDGANTNGLTYYWDFENDGANEASGARR